MVGDGLSTYLWPPYGMLKKKDFLVASLGSSVGAAICDVESFPLFPPEINDSNGVKYEQARASRCCAEALGWYDAGLATPKTIKLYNISLRIDATLCRRFSSSI